MVDIAYPIKTIMNFPLLHLEERWFGYFFSVLTLHDCIAAVLEHFQPVVVLHFLNLWAFSPLCRAVHTLFLFFCFCWKPGGLSYLWFLFISQRHYLNMNYQVFWGNASNEQGLALTLMQSFRLRHTTPGVAWIFYKKVALMSKIVPEFWFLLAALSHLVCSLIKMWPLAEAGQRWPHLPELNKRGEIALIAVYCRKLNDAHVAPPRHPPGSVITMTGAGRVGAT